MQATTNPLAILEQYAEAPVQLEAVLAGLMETDLDLALSPDTWTIRQTVHHIVDGDDIWKTCIKAALGNAEGLFSLQWYWDRPQTDWADNWAYAQRPIDASLRLFRANRRHVLELVQHAPDAWEKSIRIIWPDTGEERISAGDVLQMQAHHATGHISEIQAIRRAHRL